MKHTKNGSNKRLGAVPKSSAIRCSGQAVVEYVIALSILSLAILSLPHLVDMLAQYQGAQASALTAVFW